ncbi:MAG TPA: CDP-alcohol phosphatidyltransferase family protein [Polyangiaceae bacterium]|nr:CDP-alcohol phosphatidyltransferase family protein [Polyangiaceae bacterium]
MSNVGTQVTTLGSELSDPSPTWAPPRGRSAQAATARLAGTIWERSDVASLLYRGFYALGVGIGRLGVSANALTYASLAFAGVSCLAAVRGYFFLAAAAMVVGGLCDALDGIVARSTGTVSRYGALLDSTVDRVTDMLPLLGVALFYAGSPALALVPGIALMGTVVIPYARARAEALGANLPSLFMRRPERVVLLVVCLLLGELAVAGGMAAPLLWLGVAVLAVLNVAGGVLVLRAARRVLTANEVEERLSGRNNASASVLRR